ncbi:MAG: nucleotidyltransferase domain-containing protein [Pirellulales bacterium]|nr:nucleotidyltransferase domain-containing protein [Pirellulales bacterium]
MVSMADIEQLAAKIVREFRPDKVILFGSHARGTAGPDSDVDLLVIVRFDGKGWRKAAEIRSRIAPTFPLDLLVRAPDEMSRRVRDGDPFLKEIAEQGVELHAKDHARMGR